MSDNDSAKGYGGSGELPDLTPLCAELQRRRLAAKRSAQPILQREVADRVGVNPVQNGRLERNERSLRNLRGEQLHHLLTSYGFSAAEIRVLVQRFRLQIPPQLLDYVLPESSAGPELGAATERSPDVGPLLAELRRRRERSLDSDQPIRQTEVAERLGVSAALVSYIEKGKRPLRNLSGGQLFELLACYGFTVDEIHDLIQLYQLNAPPQLLEKALPQTFTVSIRNEGPVSWPTETEMVSFPTTYLHGLEATSLALRKTSKHDLATPRSVERVGPRAVLITSTEVEPVSGSLDIAEQRGVQFLARWPISEPWAVPYQSGGPIPPLELQPDQVQLVAVVVSCSQPLPFHHPAADL